MNFKIFRHYDIRGTFDLDFTAKNIPSIINGILDYFETLNLEKKIIALGHDARTSSPLIYKLVSTAAKKRGFNVFTFGLCSTPIISSAYFFDNNLIARIMITASHNPWQDNGFKIFYKDKNVFAEDIEIIKKLVEKHSILQSKKNNKIKIGKIFSASKNYKLYSNYLKTKISFLTNFKTPLAFDCMNGAAGNILKKILPKKIYEQSFFFRTTNFYKNINSENSSYSPDPTSLKNLTTTKDWLCKNNLPFCFVFDGDADRVTILLSNGRLLIGEEILTFFIQNCDFKENANIVVDVSCSSLINQVAKNKNLNVVSAAVGIANIKKEMESCSAVLGGENSCHFIFGNENFFYDDGIFNSFLFFKIIVAKNINLLNWLQTLPKIFASIPEKVFLKDPALINGIFLKLEKKLTKKKTVIDLIKKDGLKFFLKKGASILIRKSNTEDCLSLRFEASSKLNLTTMREEILSFFYENLQEEFYIK